MPEAGVGALEDGCPPAPGSDPALAARPPHPPPTPLLQEAPARGAQGVCELQRPLGQSPHILTPSGGVLTPRGVCVPKSQREQGGSKAT